MADWRRGFVFWGGYGGYNMGDEAILLAMSGLVRKLEPDARHFVILANRCSAETAAVYWAAQIEVIQLFSAKSIRALAQYRLIVGGGQLVDDKSMAWPVGYASALIVLNWIFKRRPLVLCIGAENVTSRIPALLVKYCYTRAEFCTCRDDHSAQALQRLGVPAAKIRVTRDVVFAIDSRLLRKPAAPEPGRAREVTMIVAHDPHRPLTGGDRFLSLADRLLRMGWRVTFTAADLRPAYDLGLLRSLSAAFRSNPDFRSSEPHTLQEFLEVLGASDLVVSARMHPLILAALLGTLPVAIPGTDKVRELVKNLDIPCFPDNPVGSGDEELIEQCLSERQTRLKSIAFKLTEFRVNVESSVAEALSGLRPRISALR